MNETLLEVKDLKVSFATYAGKVQAVRGVNFSLAKGEILAVVGESGCGKSVTAKSIIGLNPTPPSHVDGGQILLQKAVDVHEGDTPEALQRRVMEEAEWILLPRACEMVAERICGERK